MSCGTQKKESSKTCSGSCNNCVNRKAEKEIRLFPAKGPFNLTRVKSD